MEAARSRSAASGSTAARDRASPQPPATEAGNWENGFSRGTFGGKDPRMRTQFLLALGLCIAGLPGFGRGDDWPQFRGPGGTGLTAEKQLPQDWGADKNVQWKAQLPGRGWS